MKYREKTIPASTPLKQVKAANPTKATMRVKAKPPKRRVITK